MNYYVKADQFFYAHHIQTGGFLKISDGKFSHWEKTPKDNLKVVDYSGYWIAPGLVDTHIHGFAGVEVIDNNLEGLLNEMSEGLLSAGVTSFLATTSTAEHELLYQICANIGEHFKETHGAKIQGIYLEGPYFTQEHKGAQNPAYMTEPSIVEFKRWNAAAKGMIRKVAIAPELKGTEDFIREVTRNGVVVALGHSNATFLQAREAVEAGATIWVHAYNGMSAFNHRMPGMVGAVFSMENTYAELICDGHHVDPIAAKILIRAKGDDHTVLITDAIRATGLSDGEYKHGAFKVVVQNGEVRLKNGNNLAGSVLMLKDAIKNLVDWGLATPESALKMATLTPAKSAHIEEQCGQIKKGLAADFIVLEPDMTLHSVYLDGKKRW